MPKKQKYIDTSDAISDYGRAKTYWQNRSTETRKTKASGSQEYSPDINLVQLCKKYQFRGVEFGNWVPYTERVDYVNAFAECCKTLSKIMHTDNLGMFDRLGIAFGARGKSSALAHYEPDTNMINLTRKKGDQSLAHEYGHALDYIIGGYADRNSQYRALSGGGATLNLMNNTGGKIRTAANAIVSYIRTTESFKRLVDFFKKRKKYESLNYYSQATEIFARWFEEYCCVVNERANKPNLFLTKPENYYMPTGGVDMRYLTAKEMQPTMALGGLLCKWIGEGLSKNQFSTSLSAADKKAIAVFETKYIKNQK